MLPFPKPGIIFTLKYIAIDAVLYLQFTVHLIRTVVFMFVESSLTHTDFLIDCCPCSWSSVFLELKWLCKVVTKPSTVKSKQGLSGALNVSPSVSLIKQPNFTANICMQSFSRPFYPRRFTVQYRHTFLSVNVIPGFPTNDLGVGSTLS